MTSVAQETIYAGSGAGLMARVMLTTDAVGYRSLISAITYEVYVDGASQSPAVTGTLVVSTVMLTSLVAWGNDGIGKTFHWDAPGTLWTSAGTYVVVVTVTPTAGNGEAFQLKWIVVAVDARAE